MKEARNFQFGTEMDGSEYTNKKIQNQVKGVIRDHVTLFLNFAPPLINRECFKLETSFGTYILTQGVISKKMQN